MVENAGAQGRSREFSMVQLLGSRVREEFRPEIVMFFGAPPSPPNPQPVPPRLVELEYSTFRCDTPPMQLQG